MLWPVCILWFQKVLRSILRSWCCCSVVYFGCATGSSPQHLQPVWGCRRLLDVILMSLKGSGVIPIWPTEVPLIAVSERVLLTGYVLRSESHGKLFLFFYRDLLGSARPVSLWCIQGFLLFHRFGCRRWWWQLGRLAPREPVRKVSSDDCGWVLASHKLKNIMNHSLFRIPSFDLFTCKSWTERNIYRYPNLEASLSLHTLFLYAFSMRWREKMS